MLYEWKEKGAVALQGRLGCRRATLLNMIGDPAQGANCPQDLYLGKTACLGHSLNTWLLTPKCLFLGASINLNKITREQLTCTHTHSPPLTVGSGVLREVRCGILMRTLEKAT